MKIRSGFISNSSSSSYLVILPKEVTSEEDLKDTLDLSSFLEMFQHRVETGMTYNNTRSDSFLRLNQNKFAKLLFSILSKYQRKNIPYKEIIDIFPYMDEVTEFLEANDSDLYHQVKKSPKEIFPRLLYLSVADFKPIEADSLTSLESDLSKELHSLPSYLYEDLFFGVPFYKGDFH